MNAESEPVVLIAAASPQFDFETVFRTQYPRIAHLIAKVVKDSARAEELSVEVFWKLSRTPSAHGVNVSGWLHRTAVRMGLDELRKQSRREKYERLFGLSRPATTEHLQGVAEKQRQVRTVLTALERRAAEMLVLLSEGFTFQEIAEALDINPTSIGTLLSRAQRAFRKEYIKRYGQP
jgi:RNA polymerase sigma-70 factor (ECF subfamily)